MLLQFTDWASMTYEGGVVAAVNLLKGVASMDDDTDETCDDVVAHMLVAQCLDSTDELATKCPKACALSIWYNVFNTYGTHFVTTLHLGGKRTTEVIISEDTRKEIETSGSTAEAAVKASVEYEGASGSGTQ